MSTVKSLVENSLRKALVLAAGEDADIEEFNDAKKTIDLMLDSWRTENLMLYADEIVRFSLSNTQNTYTYGAALTNDFVGVRPTKILSCNVQETDGVVYPVEEITAAEWSSRTYRNTQGIPNGFYFHASYPNAEIRFDRLPIYPTVEMVVEVPVTLPDNLTDEVALPPGYENAVIFNAAVLIAPDYGKSVSQVVMGLAAKYKGQIKRQNLDVPNVQTDYPQGSGVGHYDINAGPIGGW